MKYNSRRDYLLSSLAGICISYLAFIAILMGTYIPNIEKLDKKQKEFARKIKEKIEKAQKDEDIVKILREDETQKLFDCVRYNLTPTELIISLLIFVILTMISIIAPAEWEFYLAVLVATAVGLTLPLIIGFTRYFIWFYKLDPTEK